MCVRKGQSRTPTMKATIQCGGMACTLRVGLRIEHLALHSGGPSLAALLSAACSQSERSAVTECYLAMRHIYTQPTVRIFVIYDSGIDQYSVAQKLGRGKYSEVFEGEGSGHAFLLDRCAVHTCDVRYTMCVDLLALRHRLSSQASILSTASRV